MHNNSQLKQNRLLPLLHWWFLSCLLLPATSTAQTSQDYLDLITDYTNKVDNIYDGAWSYTITEEDTLKNATTVRKIDPTQPPLETDVLLSVNGQPPTASDIKEHQRKVKKRIQRRANIANRRAPKSEEDKHRRWLEQPGNEKARFLAMLIPDSIAFVKQEGPLLHLQFKAHEEDREAMFESLIGTLILDTEREFIKEVEIGNTAAFAPFILSEIEEAYLDLHFDVINGAPMQTSMSWKLTGQAFIFKDLGGERQVVWSDFVKIKN